MSEQTPDTASLTPGEGPDGHPQQTPGQPDPGALTGSAPQPGGAGLGGGAEGALAEGGPTQQGEGEEPAVPGTPETSPEGGGLVVEGGAAG